MDMPEKLREDKKFRVAVTVGLVLFYLTYLQSLNSMGISMYIIKSYGPAVIFALLGIGLYRGSYGGKGIYYAGLLFVLWYLLTRVLLGNGLLTRSFVVLVEMSILYGLAFPFARLSGDTDRRKVLDVLALVFVVVLAAAAWLGVYFLVTGTGFYMPLSGEFYGKSPVHERLQVLGQNANHTAMLMNLGFFFTLYLLAGHFKKRWIAPAVLAMLGFYFALVLTNSRTSTIAFVICFGYAAGVLASRLPVVRRPWKAAVIVLVVLLALLASYKSMDVSMNLLTRAAAAHRAAVSQSLPVEENAEAAEESAAEPLVNTREIELNLSSMSYRGDIYLAVLPVLRAEPDILLRGTMEDDMMSKIAAVCGYEYLHMHNSFLQVLMLLGIPGLLFALWLVLRGVLASLKLLFGKTRAAEKLLPLIPMALLITSMAESLVFVPWMNLCWSLVNFLFLMVAGYLIESGDKLSFCDVFGKK